MQRGRLQRYSELSSFPDTLQDERDGLALLKETYGRELVRVLDPSFKSQLHCEAANRAAAHNMASMSMLEAKFPTSLLPHTARTCACSGGGQA